MVGVVRAEVGFWPESTSPMKIHCADLAHNANPIRIVDELNAL